jgi:acetyl-CoA C-acetyltransferase
MTNVVICSIARTPIAKFRGSFSSMKGSELGSVAIRGALSRLNQDVTIREAFLGNVVSAGMGQNPGECPGMTDTYICGDAADNPKFTFSTSRFSHRNYDAILSARQAVLGAGLPLSTICTTVNKVCASGMKSVMLSVQSLQCAGSSTPGYAMLAGGFESMSNIPHYLVDSRSGTALGHGTLLDGLIHDGLWDIYNNQHVSSCFFYSLPRTPYRT